MIFQKDAEARRTQGSRDEGGGIVLRRWASGGAPMAVNGLSVAHTPDPLCGCACGVL